MIESVTKKKINMASEVKLVKGGDNTYQANHLTELAEKLPLEETLKSPPYRS